MRKGEENEKDIEGERQTEEPGKFMGVLKVGGTGTGHDDDYFKGLESGSGDLGPGPGPTLLARVRVEVRDLGSGSDVIE